MRRAPRTRNSSARFRISDANEMLDRLCETPLVEKTRHLVEHGGNTFEIDEFHGENAGLIVAEVELESEDANIDSPRWLGVEVTNDPRYFNVNLVRSPVSKWRGDRAAQ